MICAVFIITDTVIYQVKVHYVVGKYVISLILLCVTMLLGGWQNISEFALEYLLRLSQI